MHESRERKRGDLTKILRPEKGFGMGIGMKRGYDGLNYQDCMKFGPLSQEIDGKRFQPVTDP